MIRFKKYTSTYNEYFAHKKNVGEEAKLRARITCIDRKFGLVKDALKHDIGNVKTSLKNLRMSTGHSIDALPPTPFRFDPRRVSIMPLVTRDSCSTLLPTEANYLLEDINDDQQNLTVNPKASLDAFQSNDTYDRINIDKKENRGGPFICNSDYSNEEQSNQLEGISNDAQSKITRHHDKDDVTDVLNYSQEALVRAPEDKLMVSQSVTFNNKLSNSAATQQVKLPTIDRSVFHNLVGLSAGNQHSYSSEQQKTESNATISLTPVSNPRRDRPNQPVLLEQTHNQILIDLSSNGSDSSLDITPLSREISSVLKDGELRRRDHVRQNSFVGFDDQVSAILRNGNDQVIANNSKTTQNENKFSENNVTKTKSKKNAWPTDIVLRDARTRCRTCIVRFRQNAEFQRRKLELERQAEQDMLNTQAEADPLRGPRIREKTSELTLDLESLKSDEVLDFSDAELDEKTRPSKYNYTRPKKGYSRLRMSQLAEPKKNKKRPTLFSKQLIKKEVDTLIEKHAGPLMTDREKERLRVLQSKISTFLATMQEELRPSTMVHIPQRDDIMNVDISHL